LPGAVIPAKAGIQCLPAFAEMTVSVEAGLKQVLFLAGSLFLS